MKIVDFFIFNLHEKLFLDKLAYYDYRNDVVITAYSNMKKINYFQFK